MRSTRNLLLLLLSSFLLCTACYFGYRSYNLRKQVEVPKKEAASAELVMLDRTPEEKKASAEEPEILLALPAPEVHQELSDSTPKEKIETSPVILYSEKEDEIENVVGAVFLKTMLKNMECVLGELSPYSVSCCGKMSLADDGSDEQEACVLLDTYQALNVEDTFYRLRIIFGGELTVYEEVVGFPRPASKCYPLNNKPGVDICVSLNLLVLDNDVSDDLGYKTCTFMKFGYSHSVPYDLLGYAETLNCNSEKQVIDKKGSSTPFSVVLRLKTKSPIEEFPKNVSFQDENDVDKNSVDSITSVKEVKENPELTPVKNEETILTDKTEEPKKDNETPETVEKSNKDNETAVVGSSTDESTTSSDFDSQTSMLDSSSELSSSDESFEGIIVTPTYSTEIRGSGMTMVFNSILDYIRNFFKMFGL